MKISDLILELQRYQDIWGDLPLVAEASDGSPRAREATVWLLGAVFSKGSYDQLEFQRYVSPSDDFTATHLTISAHY